jgi:flagellar basal body rod protein FlgG
MFLNPSLEAALDRIASRAADVRRAFTPGAVPTYDDVAAAASSSQFTLDPLSVAPPAGTYFVVRSSDGGLSYTRDGVFHLDGGALHDAGERPLLGIRSPGAALEELCVDPVDAALGRASDPRIGSDGTFGYARSVIDPRTGNRSTQRVAVGRVALARFPAATKLEMGASGSLRAPGGVVPYTGTPSDGALPALEPMRRGNSGIDIDESLARLKAAYVAFDALAAAETAKGRIGKTAMDLIK